MEKRSQKSILENIRAKQLREINAAYDLAAEDTERYFEARDEDEEDGGAL